MPAPRLTFRDYVRVIRRQPGGRAKAAGFAALDAAIALRDGWVVAVLIAGGIPVFAVLWFPVWRHFAPRNPSRWTFGCPENLRAPD